MIVGNGAALRREEAARTTKTLETRLGYRFKDVALLERALTHRSFAYERGAPRVRDYERLEFLGDSLLGFVVADWLYRDDREALEGALSRRKQALVRAETLAAVASSLGLGDALRLGRGEASTGGREKPSLLADALEAVIGAVYVDGGLRAARAVVRRHLRESFRGARGVQELPDDYKTRLQEEVQGRIRITPRYRVVATSGPAHAREFRVEVLVDGEVLGSGSGTSRKQAEQEAARVALEQVPGGEAADS